METLETIRAIASRDALPDKEAYVKLLERAITALEHENRDARPPDSTGLSGGLVRLDKNIPTLILPDLHGRTDFFRAVLESPSATGGTVAGAIQSGTLQMLCLGDGFHSERRGKKRWLNAFEEYTHGFRKREAMDNEMTESLSLMEMVMECKCAFRDRFHFLKGNHENILNEEGNGNHAFRKFSFEGEMVREYVTLFFGQDFLELYALFEKRLPLFAIGRTFLASHAEPYRFFSEEELIEARVRPEVTLGLTWTGNDEASDGSVRAMLNAYLPDFPGAVYLGGHRPVPETYLLRAENKYVQIHNPEREIVALAPPDRPFNPDTDIKEL